MKRLVVATWQEFCRVRQAGTAPETDRPGLPDLGGKASASDIDITLGLLLGFRLATPVLVPSLYYFAALNMGGVVFAPS
ncbi:MAG: hypothetical protein U0075_11290 [Thermomicrobiales bacterium]